MKINGKFRFVSGFLVGALTFGSISIYANDIVAKLTTQKLLVNNKEVNIEGYNINDRNYYQLRDLSGVLGFEILFNQESNTVLLNTQTKQIPVPNVSANPTPTVKPTPTVTPTQSPTSLIGEWKQTNSNSENNYQVATISGDTIEIFWLTNNGNTKSLYWAGSFIAPTDNEESYAWESKNDHSKTKSAILASDADTKKMNYKDGVLSYEASALGITTTVKLEKQN